jgi:MFS family permease
MSSLSDSPVTPTDLEKEESKAVVPEPFKPSGRFYLAFISLALSALAAAIDATSLSVALPTITHDLGGTSIEAFWAGTSFLLASTICQPVFTSLSHVFGRKSMIYAALSFFAVGSVLAAVAQDFKLLLTGRTSQGIGGGGIMVMCEIAIVDLVPRIQDRGKWQGTRQLPAGLSNSRVHAIQFALNMH